MNPTNLSQFYGGNLISPTQSVADRFALPGFKEAANKAGFDENSYGINMGNADANNKILQNLITGKSSQLINTSTQSRTQTAQAASGLDAALARLGMNNNGGQNTPDNNGIEGTDKDPIIMGLNRLQTNSDDATKSFIASVQAKYQNEKNKANGATESYKGGLQQLGIETNQAQATPDLLAGHIRQATLDNLDKIHDLDTEETKAIMDAKNAKDSNDFKTLQAKMDYIDQIKKAKSDALKSMYDNLSTSNKASAIEAHDIYDTMQTLNDADKEKFILAVAQKYNLPVMSLVQALNDEKQSREVFDVDLANKKRLLNSGSGGSSGSMSKAQIQLGEDKLNATRGSDGYVDPYVYAQAFKDWTGTTKQFLAAFPPKDYVNPAATNLPPYLMPPQSKSSDGAQTP